MAKNRTPLITFCTGEVMARSEMMPWSFPNATRLPLNESEPMMQPMMVEATAVPDSRSARIAACRKSPVEINAAAPPPKPLRSATIWGICVICTQRAPAVPSAAPITIPATMSPWLWNPPPGIHRTPRVAAVATAMPIAAIRLPRRARAGELRNLSPTMKRTAEAR